MRVVVFLGPSLTHHEARQVLPHATYLPPARQGDVLSAIRRWDPDVIALVDGTFLHTLAVWHKEILHGLDRGVAVYGASSMGALRAAECAPFGMVGVGRIYEAYADGTLTDDDEVALLHADEADGWRALSEPMVNIRATFAAAVDVGSLSEDERRSVADAAKSLYFPHRSWPEVLDASDLDDEALDRVRQVVATRRVDQKRLDAVELLETIAALDAPPPTARGWRFHRTPAFEGMQWRDLRVERDDGGVSLESIARHAMLHRRDAIDVVERAAAREAQQLLGELLAVQVSDEDVADEVDRLRRRLGLGSDEAFAEYLRRSDLDAAELDELMRRVATSRALQHRLRDRYFQADLTKSVLDELRLRDEYGAWADRAARHEGVLREIGEPRELGALAELVGEHLAATDWRPDCELPRWSEETGFGPHDQLHAELTRAAAVRAHLAELAGDQGASLRATMAQLFGAPGPGGEPAGTDDGA